MRNQTVMQLILFTVPLVLVWGSQGRAQLVSATGGPVRRLMQSSAGTTMNVNFQLNAPLSATISEEDRTAAIDKAQHNLLNLVNHECNQLHETMNAECKLVQLNLSANLGFLGGSEASAPYMNVSAQGTFEITPIEVPIRP
jgi:hypothetical protein